MVNIDNIIEISQRIEKLWSEQDFPFKIHSRAITAKGCKVKQLFMYARQCLDLI